MRKIKLPDVVIVVVITIAVIMTVFLLVRPRQTATSSNTFPVKPESRPELSSLQQAGQSLDRIAVSNQVDDAHINITVKRHDGQACGGVSAIAITSRARIVQSGPPTLVLGSSDGSGQCRIRRDIIPKDNSILLTRTDLQTHEITGPFESDYTITMRPTQGHMVRFLTTSQNGVPLPDVGIAISRGALPCNMRAYYVSGATITGAGRNGVLIGKTNIQGICELTTPTNDDYCVSVWHEAYVAMAKDENLKVTANTLELRIAMAPVYCCALRVMNESISGYGGGIRGPVFYPESVAPYVQKVNEVKARFQGCLTFVAFRNFENADHGPLTATVKLCLANSGVIDVCRELLPLAEHPEAYVVDTAAGGMSKMGKCRIQLADRNGKTIDPSHLELQSSGTSDLIPFEVAASGKLSVPVGNYGVSSRYEHVILAAASRRIEVRSDVVEEQLFDLRCDTALVPVQIHVTQNGSSHQLPVYALAVRSIGQRGHRRTEVIFDSTCKSVLMPPGTYEVSIRATGYKTATRQVVIDGSQEVVVCGIDLVDS